MSWCCAGEGDRAEGEPSVQTNRNDLQVRVTRVNTDAGEHTDEDGSCVLTLNLQIVKAAQAIRVFLLTFRICPTTVDELKLFTTALCCDEIDFLPLRN